MNARRRLPCLQSIAILAAALALGVALDPATARAAPEVGKPAPAFTATDAGGQPVSLADYKGKTVVLEWTNHECPYVSRHYGTGNMQRQQKAATADGIVWLSIISSAPGEQGHVSPQEAQALTDQRSAAPTGVLFDPKGTVGRAYGARTTPHMYIVDKAGTLVYMGGIDSEPTSWGEIKPGTVQYVPKALAELKAGKPIADAVTRPYGCTVKYAY